MSHDFKLIKLIFPFKCRSLETGGYESFVVITSEDGHFQLGSKKGTDFLDSHLGLISEFVQFCRGNEPFLHMGVFNQKFSFNPKI